MKKNFVFDNDAGADDLLALFFLLKNKKINLRKIISSYGNYPLSSSNNRINKFLEEFNFKINLYKGSKKPIFRKYNFHGFDIHGDLWAEDKFKKLELFFLNGLSSVFKNDKKKYTYVVTGPLTNLSKLIDKNKNNLGDIFIMGGSLFYPGNATPNSEANFYWDPEATKKVLLSKNKKYLIPLNLTDKIQIDYKKVKKFKHSIFKKIMKPYCDFYSKNKKEVFLDLSNSKMIYKGGAVHDLVAAVVSVFPEIATFEEQFISLSNTIEGKGAVIPVFRKEHINKYDELVKIKVAKEININKFWKIIDDVFLK
jgi:purine nucleosidase